MRGLFREFVVAKRRTENRHDERMVQAYTIAALIRSKKLPQLNTLLAKREVRQNARQMLTVTKLISEAYGIPLRKKKTKKHG